MINTHHINTDDDGNNDDDDVCCCVEEERNTDAMNKVNKNEIEINV